MGKKASVDPAEKAPTSTYLARARMIEIIQNYRVKCENGDLKALIVAIDLTYIAHAPLPHWLAQALHNLVRSKFDAHVIGKGKKGTIASRKNENSIHWERYLLVNENIKKFQKPGKKLKKKQLFILDETEDLVNSGVWAKPGAVRASYEQVERDLKDPNIDFEEHYPGDMADLIQIFAENFQD